MGLITRSRFANLCVYSAETTGNFHLVVLLKLVFLDKPLGQDHFLGTSGERYYSVKYAHRRRRSFSKGNV